MAGKWCDSENAKQKQNEKKATIIIIIKIYKYK